MPPDPKGIESGLRKNELSVNQIPKPVEGNGSIKPNDQTLVQNCNFINWKPTPVVSIASSVDGSAIAVARDSGEIEIWKVAPGSVGWNCEAIIYGKPDSSISSLIWCLNSKLNKRGKLFSASLEGTITEWNLFSLKEKNSVDSFGGSVWCLSPEPTALLPESTETNKNKRDKNRKQSNAESDSSDDEDDDGDDDKDDDEDDDEDGKDKDEFKIAAGCDDGRVQILTCSRNSNEFKYSFSFPIVKGRILSVTWNSDATRLFSGTSIGRIHCWDCSSKNELYRLTTSQGNVKRMEDLCTWALLYLNDGTLVSGDGSGHIQFWDSHVGTLMHSQKRHVADILSLSASPSQDSVFSAGVDGRVILYEKSKSSNTAPWIYVEKRHPHTHDVRCLSVVLIPFDDGSSAPMNKQIDSKKEKAKEDETRRKIEKKNASSSSSFIPLLVSGGNDAQIITYSIDSFLSFKPHRVNPHPQIPFTSISSPSPFPSSSPSPSLVKSSRSPSPPLLLVQNPSHIEIWKTFPIHSKPNSNSNSNDNKNKDYASANGKVHSSKNGVAVLSLKPNTLSLSLSSFPSSDVDKIGDKRKLEFHPGSNKKIKIADVATDNLILEESNVKTNRFIPIRERKKQIFANLHSNDNEKVNDDDIRTPVMIAKINTRVGNRICCSVISPDGRYVSVSDSSKVRVYTLACTSTSASGQNKEKWSVKKKTSLPLPPAHHLLFCSDSMRLIIAANDGRIWIYNVSEGCIIRQFSSSPPPSPSPSPPPPRSPLFFLACSEDSQWLSICNSSNHIQIYNLETLRLHWTVPLLDSSNLTHGVFLSDNQTMAVLSSSNRFFFLDVESMAVIPSSHLNHLFLTNLKNITENFTRLLVFSSSPSSPSSPSPTLVAYNSRYVLEIDIDALLYRLKRSNKFLKKAEKAPETENSPEAFGPGAHSGSGSGSKKQQGNNSSISVKGNFFRVEQQNAAPLLFLGQVTKNHFLKIQKPWMEVASKFPAPLYIHKFGT